MTTTLPQIAPAKSCYTCRHMATHAKCDGCLDGTPRGEPFPYRNWEDGPWQVDLARAELLGTHSIVIGGQGELEVKATERDPAAFYQHAFRVSCECGYLIESPRTSEAHGGCREVVCHLHHGTFAVVFSGATGRLAFIDQINRHGQRSTFWSAETTQAFLRAYTEPEHAAAEARIAADLN